MGAPGVQRGGGNVDRLEGFLEAQYARYNRAEFAAQDPVRFVREHADPLEREVVALLAASLAYGRIEAIKRSVRELLSRLGGRPRRFVLRAQRGDIISACAGFRHRFTGAAQMASLLWGIRQALLEHGSLERCFGGRDRRADETIVPAVGRFVAQLARSPRGIPHLLPSPRGGSACKRLCLFLRWMVRHDQVDPGGWACLEPAELIVPLDVHMHRACSALGLLRRGQADLKAALEATKGFRRIRPEDPVRYDFALMHMTRREGLAALP